jgi:beta-1,2-N-acetylglucosaminyltransferase
MNTYFHDNYFKKHAFNRQPNVRLKDVQSLKKDNYEQVISDLLRKAVILDHSRSPCETNFFPASPVDSSDTYVLFIKQADGRDFQTWLRLAKCLKIWDLDARGQHRGLWRLFVNNSHLLVVGVPFSPYSAFKPSSVTPVFLDNIDRESERSPNQIVY